MKNVETGKPDLSVVSENQRILMDYFGFASSQSLIRLNYAEIRNIVDHKRGQLDFKLHLTLFIAKFGNREINQEAADLIREYFDHPITLEELVPFDAKYEMEDLYRYNWRTYEARLFAGILKGNLSNSYGRLLTSIGHRNLRKEWHHTQLVQNASNNDLIARLNTYLWTKERKKKGSLPFCEMLFSLCGKSVPSRENFWALLIEELFAQDIDLVVEIWFVFAYLGEYKLVNMIIEWYEKKGILDAEQRYQKFCARPDFSFAPYEEVSRVSDRLESMVGEKKTASTINLRSDLTKWSWISFIVKIAIARSRGDIETEVFLLRHLCYRTRKAIHRLEEVTGIEIAEGFKSASLNMSLWVEKRTKLLDGKDKHNHLAPLSRIELAYIRDLYPIIPFSPHLLKYVFRAEKQTGNIEYRKMYQFILAHIRTPKQLSLALSSAVSCKNFNALSYVLERIANLSLWDVFAETLIFRMQKVARLSDMLPEWVTALQMMLQVFYQYADRSAQQRLQQRVSVAAINGHGSIAETFKRLVETRSKSRVPRTLSIKSVGGYEHVASRLANQKERFETSELVDILRFLMEHPKKDSYLIVTAYQKLAALDPSLASYYNPDVEFHIVKMNRNAKEDSRISYGMTSRVWQIPAILENPINRTAKDGAGLKYRFSSNGEE